MRFCTNCGAEIADESKFCSNCGSKMEDAVKAVVTEETATDEQETFYSAETFEQNGLDIKYEDEEPVYSSTEVYQTPQTQYYESSVQTAANSGNGNIGFSIAAMVCGIISLFCCCFWYFSVILAIAAVVLGVISIKNEYEGKGMAIAGLVTGGITIFGLIILLILGGALNILDI